MFLIFGSDPIAIRLAEWIGARSRVRIVGLADQLIAMKDVEIVALPTEMELHEMPLDSGWRTGTPRSSASAATAPRSRERPRPRGRSGRVTTRESS